MFRRAQSAQVKEALQMAGENSAEPVPEHHPGEPVLELPRARETDQQMRPR